MSLTLGEITIQRVVEMEGPFTEPHMLLPDVTPEGMAAHRHWLAPQFVQEAESFPMGTRGSSKSSEEVNGRRTTKLDRNGRHNGSGRSACFG